MGSSDCRKYEPFFGKWKISKELGKGAFGRVYEIYWDDEFSGRTKSALKFMHIPSEEALKMQQELQPSKEAVRAFFAKHVEKIRDEIRILQKCKGHSNIVTYEDHLIVETTGQGEIGWDIMIRMELLYPLQDYFSEKFKRTQMDVMRMWADITNALIFCEEQDIIHRDIKPANILVSDKGQFKLSDFGAARKNLQGQDASTRIGTERYMAPEVYKGQKYDKRADYYSLGIVIYYYLNYRRHPFLPPYPKVLDADDYAMAEGRRIKGDRVPPIPHTIQPVNQILLKCIAYNAGDRFKSAKMLYQAIQGTCFKYGNNLLQIPLDPPGIRQGGPAVNPVSSTGISGISKVGTTGVGTRPKGSRLVPVLAAVSFVGAASAIGAVFLLGNRPPGGHTGGSQPGVIVESYPSLPGPTPELPPETGGTVVFVTQTPTLEVTEAPTAEPTQAPKAEATTAPKPETTAVPKAEETQTPKAEATAAPKAEATTAPKAEETKKPKKEETPKPTPTKEPEAEVTKAPTEKPKKKEQTTVIEAPVPEKEEADNTVAAAEAEAEAAIEAILAAIETEESQASQEIAGSKPEPTQKATESTDTEISPTPRKESSKTPTPKAEANITEAVEQSPSNTTNTKDASTSEPQVTSKPEKASTPEPKVTSVPEPEVTSAPEPKVTSVPEPEVTSAPEPKVTSVPEPEVTSAPEPKVTSVPEPKVTSVPEPEVTSAPEPKVTSVPEPEVTSVPEPEVTSTPEPEVTSVPESEVTSVPEPEVTSVPEPEVTSVPEPEVTSRPEPEVTPTPKEEVTPPPTPTPTPEPAALMYGGLTRPKQGEEIDDSFAVVGSFLTHAKVGDVEVYCDLIQDGKVVDTIELSRVSEMGEQTFLKKQEENASEIAADSGYEIKEKLKANKLTSGSCEVVLRAVDPKSGEEIELDRVEISVNSGKTQGIEELMESNEAIPASAKSYTVSEEHGYAVGLDDVKDSAVSPSQIVFTGWINADTGSSVSALVDIDGTSYTADALAAAGGSITVTRAPRSLEKIDSKKLGGSQRSTEEAGLIISVDAPFLKDGKHDIQVILNVSAAGMGSADLVDLKKISVQTDSSVSGDSQAAEKIKSAWAKELPQPVQVTEPAASQPSEAQPAS